jgi:hypothetical protein
MDQFTARKHLDKVIAEALREYDAAGSHAAGIEAAQAAFMTDIQKHEGTICLVQADLMLATLLVFEHSRNRESLERNLRGIRLPSSR